MKTKKILLLQRTEMNDDPTEGVIELQKIAPSISGTASFSMITDAQMKGEPVSKLKTPIRSARKIPGFKFL